jgi:hypothetical protein
MELSDQANGATQGHAAAMNPLTPAQRDAIVNFEMALFTAQSTDTAAGLLNAQGGAGGPVALSRQPSYIGINDVLSGGFDQRAFTLFDAWRDLAGSVRDPYAGARAAVARGQDIFNTRRFTIANVRGVNVQGTDASRLGGPSPLLPQRSRGDTGRGRRVLRCPVQHRLEPAGEG